MDHGKTYLFLHKDEWNRLRSIGAETHEPSQSNEYIRALIEKSQQWINSWPDSAEGYKRKQENEKKRQFAKDMAMIKLLKREQQTAKRNKCIEKAKQIIFDDSCYGQKLISALVESKVLEERDAQIDFQKKLKERALMEEQEAIQSSVPTAIDNIINSEEERVKCQREKDKEVAEINKIVYLTRCYNKKKEMVKEKQMEMEDLQIIAKLNEKEAALDANQKMEFQQDFELFEAERKKIKEIKALRESEEERKIEIWRKYEDRRNAMIKKIQEERFGKPQSTEVYKLIEKLKIRDKNRYDEFVNKGITIHNRRIQIKEEEDKQRKVDEHKQERLKAQANQTLEEANRIVKNVKINASTCNENANTPKCRQSTLIRDMPPKQNIMKFMPLKNALVKNLKTREREPSPWSGVSAAHAQFARCASQTLQECRFKRAARKVVDDYRREHGLTPENLRVANYY